MICLRECHSRYFTAGQSWESKVKHRSAASDVKGFLAQERQGNRDAKMFCIPYLTSTFNNILLFSNMASWSYLNSLAYLLL